MPAGMCWPVMRLVMAGQDYAAIESTWNLPMVLKVNEAMDIQEEANRLASEQAKQNRE